MSNSAVQVSGVKREHIILVAAVVAIVAILWVVLLIMVGNMRGMPSAAKMEMAAMEMKAWTPADFALMFSMWCVMMTGMMVPSATPAILKFATLSREHRKRGRAYAPTAVFVMGYVVVWVAFSFAATLLSGHSIHWRSCCRQWS